MAFDFFKWAVVAYNDDTGLGRMAQDIKEVLGLRQLVVRSERLSTKPLEENRDFLLKGDASEDEIIALLEQFEGLILLERLAWHSRLLPVAKRLGVLVVCVPMWEWFSGTDPECTLIDLFICPSHFSLGVVRSYGWKSSVYLPWALDLSRLPRRAVNGPAKIFFHNAGLVDHDDRKGTRETIAAFRKVADPNVRLILRLQKQVELPPLDERIELRVGNLEDPASLYAEGDVAVQPSKMEGIGFMVLEPICCGVPTITTDYPPMNDYAPHPELLVRKSWFKRTAFPGRAARIAHAHLRLPSVRDLARKIEWCAENDVGRFSRENLVWADREFAADRIRDCWGEVLNGLR